MGYNLIKKNIIKYKIILSEYNLINYYIRYYRLKLILVIILFKLIFEIN